MAGPKVRELVRPVSPEAAALYAARDRQQAAPAVGDNGPQKGAACAERPACQALAVGKPVDCKNSTGDPRSNSSSRSSWEPAPTDCKNSVEVPLAGPPRRRSGKQPADAASASCAAHSRGVGWTSCASSSLGAPAATAGSAAPEPRPTQRRLRSKQSSSAWPAGAAPPRPGGGWRFRQQQRRLQCRPASATDPSTAMPPAVGKEPHPIRSRLEPVSRPEVQGKAHCDAEPECRAMLARSSQHCASIPGRPEALGAGRQLLSLAIRARDPRTPLGPF